MAASTLSGFASTRGGTYDRHDSQGWLLGLDDDLSGDQKLAAARRRCIERFGTDHIMVDASGDWVHRIP